MVILMKQLLILSAFLFFGCAAFAQKGLEHADKLPVHDSVAWSGMQSPQFGPTASQNTPAAAQDAAPAVHTVTGSISKDGDSYVLKVSDTTSYKLDDQDKAKQYDGQKVRVTGEVDLNTNQIHVQKIEPLV
jgi:uncharacterized protein YdeI (BOF family)